MKSNRLLGLRYAEWLVVFVILAVLFAMLLPALRHQGGRWLPNLPPEEVRRVFHPKGFSIVCPPGWRVTTVDHDDTRYLLLTPGDKLRDAPGLSVHLIDPLSDLSEFNECSFLGQKAYDRRRVSGGSHARSSYYLVVNSSNQWYQVVYSETRAFDENPSMEIPEMMMRYIQSFRP